MPSALLAMKHGWDDNLAMCPACHQLEGTFPSADERSSTIQGDSWTYSYMITVQDFLTLIGHKCMML